MKLPFRLLPIAAAVWMLVSIRSADAAGVGWKSWNAGMAEAHATGKPVLVDVYTEWCGWCKRMDRDVYSRPEVRDYLARKFVVVRLDAESSDLGTIEDKSMTMSAIAQRFHVNGYPTTIFLRANGDHLVNVPGYIPAERFMLMLQYIGDDHIGRGVKWSDFERNGGAPAAR